MKRKIVLLLTVVMMLSFAGCKSKDTVSPATASEATPSQVDTFVVATENETEEPTEATTEKDDTVTISENETVNRSESETESRNERATTAPTTKPAKAAQSNKVWHNAVYKTVEHPAETEEVWIVDNEAYTYELSVYEFKDIVICNLCDQDVTDIKTEHQDEHSESVTYHTETQKVAVGTELVLIPEEGHYETVVVKEAWTEKILVKEAGYY